MSLKYKQRGWVTVSFRRIVFAKQGCIAPAFHFQFAAMTPSQTQWPKATLSPITFPHYLLRLLLFHTSRDNALILSKNVLPSFFFILQRAFKKKSDSSQCTVTISFYMYSSRFLSHNYPFHFWLEKSIPLTLHMLKY